MKQLGEKQKSKTAWWLARFGALALIAAAVAVSLCAQAATAQSSSEQAEAQYQKAEQMRQAVEATSDDTRTLADYKSLVAAYRRVYLLSSSAGAVTPALMEVAQLYHDMGDQFDQAYYQNALVTYKFLIAQYPGSKFRTDALFEVGKIEKENLAEGPEARDAFTQFLQLYPSSPRAADARQALKEIAEGKLAARKPTVETAAKAAATTHDAAESGEQMSDSDSATREDAAAQPATIAESVAQPSPDGSQTSPAKVTAIRTWNADDYTRVVVDLDGAVKYESARIKNPDRIYFDLYSAHLGRSITDKEMPVQNGFLKSVRVAQNKDGVVRLVLDVQSVEGYSAFLLPDPFRLVIDVHGAISNAGNKKAGGDVGVGKLAGDAAATSVVPPAPSEKVQVPANSTAAPETAADATSSAVSPDAGRDARTLPVPRLPATAAPPTRDGERSLTRTLGLKISRIVIDPGHGGHDTGTIGPHGLMEKNVCLDVALRLGKLIQKKLPGAEVIYTRKTDVFIPLEERTAIANQAKADLFISIHANSSHNETARGIETYYLNFTTSQEALETASRENALSDESIHELQDLIKKIANNDKIEESRELASDIQNSLSGQLRKVSTAERDRGVKKAPFVVLIGADMPSVLAEISFLSNPTDERMLEKASQRQRIAQGLFRGVESYLSSLNSLAIDRQKLMTVQQPSSTGSSREQR